MEYLLASAAGSKTSTTQVVLFRVMAVNGTTPGLRSGLTYDIKPIMNVTMPEAVVGNATRSTVTITHSPFPTTVYVTAAPVGSLVLGWTHDRSTWSYAVFHETAGGEACPTA